MDEVIEISSDDDDVEPLVGENHSATPSRELADALTILGISDVCELQRAVSAAVESHAHYADMQQEIREEERSQACLADMIDDLTSKTEDLKQTCTRLGNPLVIESCCDGDGEIVDWDPLSESLVFPDMLNPNVRTISYTERGGIVKNLVLPEKEEFVDSGEESETDEIVYLEPDVHKLSVSKSKIPAVGEPVVFNVNPGDFVFACEEPENVSSCWLRAKINQSFEKDGTAHFVVDFCSGKTNCIRSADFLVSSKPQPNRLEVRQRVVAYYRYRPDLSSRPHRLMAGFVAEVPRHTAEYLIFFDNGRAGYVHHDECFAYFNSKMDDAIQRIKLSDSATQFNGQFLTKYFQNFPEQMKLKVVRNKTIHFLDEGKWTKGKVKSIHASLVQIVLKSKNETHWLYRGSWMLRDIFANLFPEQYFSIKEPARKRTRATRKLSLAPPPRGNRKSKFNADRKMGNEMKKKPKPRNLSQHVVQFTNDEVTGSDSDYTDCSVQSFDGKDCETRKRTFVKKKSTEFGDRMILERKSEHRKPNFPITAALYAESVQKRLVNGKKSFSRHACSESCLILSHDEEEKRVNHMLGRENPFAIPLILGWKREVRSHEFISRTRGEEESGSDIYYRSPCGKSISSSDELNLYLSCTRSSIPVDLFAFDPDLEVFCKHKDIGCFYYDPDLSHGVEETPISVVNELEDKGPEPFVYRNVFTLAEDTRYDRIATNPYYRLGRDPPFDQDFMSCCSCTDNCEDADQCECQALTKDMGRIIYPVHEDNSTGYKFRRLELVIHSGIYECHSRCPCNNSCPNRLVQLKSRNRLQVFKTGRDRGWGIRALHDIPKGAFLCQYVARILTPEQGNDGTHDDTYFADLDHIRQLEANKRYHAEHPEDFIEDDEDSEETIQLKREMMQGIHWVSVVELFDEAGTYVVDAIREGNIGRFFNHSCEPNCEVQNVFLHTQDPRFPAICIFTMRTVKALEELTWDYGYEVDSIPGRKMYCKCGSRRCRRRLL